MSIKKTINQQHKVKAHNLLHVNVTIKNTMSNCSLAAQRTFTGSLLYASSPNYRLPSTEYVPDIFEIIQKLILDACSVNRKSFTPEKLSLQNVISINITDSVCLYEFFFLRKIMNITTWHIFHPEPSASLSAVTHCQAETPNTCQTQPDERWQYTSSRREHTVSV